MHIQQLYTGCMSHAAYFIVSKGEVAIFDPLREVQPYIDLASQHNGKIKYIFETHFHADFVSGHLDLANKTGAKIVYGPTAKPNFEAIIAEDSQVFILGDCKIKVLHTPGHTLESTTYLIYDENGKEHGIITGDTLFIGDVGRPDLAQHVVEDLTEEILAKKLYNSLQEKILPLPDHLIVYPNHGAGSACGKNMSKETTDILGNQKKTNYALRPGITESEFVAEVLEGLTRPPGYFPKNVLMNIKGYESLDTILERGLKELSVHEVDSALQAKDVLILDTRDPDVYAKGHLPGSLNIGINGNFAMWVGELIHEIKQKIIFVAEDGKEKEVITRLSRVGYDNTIGFLNGGYDSWVEHGMPIRKVTRVTPEVAVHKVVDLGFKIVDVRKLSEFNAQHWVEAISVPLNDLYHRLEELSSHEPFVLHCAGGYRSMMAASILLNNGIENFVEVSSGFKGLQDVEVSCTEYRCPSSML